MVVERAGRRYSFQAAKTSALPELRTPLAKKLWALSEAATARGLEPWDATRSDARSRPGGAGWRRVQTYADSGVFLTAWRG